MAMRFGKLLHSSKEQSCHITFRDCFKLIGSPRLRTGAVAIVLFVLLISECRVHAEADLPAPTPLANRIRARWEQKENIWIDGVGDGFQPGTQTLQLGMGFNYGLDLLGSWEKHHLVNASISYGRVIGSLWNANRWFEGNLELRLELFGGLQIDPHSEWFVGLTPHLRYHFMTGTKLVPFFDVGAGVTATGISTPDLGGTFEFNLQGGVGIQWFVRDNAAFVVETRYVHWSSAGLSSPNRGLNGITGALGIAFYF